MATLKRTSAPAPSTPDGAKHGPTYLQLALARKANRKDLLDSQSPASSAIYYWDATRSQFIDPINVSPDAAIVPPNRYVLSANVYAFSASASDMENLLGESNNVQVSFTAQTAQSGEDYTWIIKAGLNIAGDFVNLSNQPNQLTNIPSPQDQVVIENGKVSLWFGLGGQKKEGWWDTFLKAIGIVTDSPLFAVVPMAKLVSQAVSAITQMTEAIEQQEHVSEILQGHRLDCRISGNDASFPFVLRSGFWLITNYAQIKEYVDYGDRENLNKNLFLDIASEQYNVVAVDEHYAPVDLTYAVIRVSLDAKTN